MRIFVFVSPNSDSRLTAKYEMTPRFVTDRVYTRVALPLDLAAARWPRSRIIVRATGDSIDPGSGGPVREIVWIKPSETPLIQDRAAQPR